MSDHDDCDCAFATAQTWGYLDGECSGALRRILTRHLSECSECWVHYVAQARMKLIVATKAAGERAPERLRKIVIALTTRG